MTVNSAGEFYSFIRKSHKTNLNLNQDRISTLNKLVREERMQLQQKCKVLCNKVKNKNKLQQYLEDAEAEIFIDKIKAREVAKHNQQIYKYVKSKIEKKHTHKKRYNAKQDYKNDSDKNKAKTFNLENSWKHHRKHIAMPARTITITKNDENVFLSDKNEPDNGVISQENTSFLSSTTNKIFSSLSKTNDIVDSGIKTCFNFISTSNNICEEKRIPQTPIKYVRITSKVEVVLHFYVKTFFTYKEYYVMMTHSLINQNVLFVMFLYLVI